LFHLWQERVSNGLSREIVKKNLKGEELKRVEKFKKGYLKFKKVDFKDNKKRFKKLVKKGQRPSTLFITCSDSRVVPNLITETGPGELFIVRNIGNFVPPFSKKGSLHCTGSAIEYAVSHLEVTDIIVCGHSDCGAVKELFLKHTPTKENLNIINWLNLGKGVKKRTLESVGNKPFSVQRDFAEKLSAVTQIKNLLTYPAVKKRVKKGELFLHAWHYKIDSGEIYYYDDESKEYKRLDEV
jgi:carbonic anhydrase